MYKIKDLFDFDDNQNDKKKSDSQIDRMKHLNETYNKRGEFLVEDKEKEVDEKKIIEEANRLRKLSSHRLVNEEANSSLNGMPFAGHGETVNTFTPAIASAAGPNATYIKPAEALDIAVKRAIESGAPVNNMGFYDEVNWHLNNLGFDSKLPIDIKGIIVKIVGGDLDAVD